MRKVIIMFALAMGIATANAQENVTVETTKGSEQPTLTKEVYPQKEADGDLYHGLSRKLTFDRMIPPHGLEVTYDKTVHVILSVLCHIFDPAAFFLIFTRIGMRICLGFSR